MVSLSWSCLNSDNNNALTKIILLQIGNAVLNDETDQPGMVDHAWSHAIISDELHAAIRKDCTTSSRRKRKAGGLAMPVHRPSMLSSNPMPASTFTTSTLQSAYLPSPNLLPGQNSSRPLLSLMSSRYYQFLPLLFRKFNACKRKFILNWLILGYGEGRRLGMGWGGCGQGAMYALGTAWRDILTGRTSRRRCMPISPISPTLPLLAGTYYHPYIF